MAEKQPIAYNTMGLLEFQARFPGEHECYDYLVKMRFSSGIARGSIVRTDGLHVYRCFFELGFSHEATVTSDKVNGSLLHWVHIVISNAKAFITGTFHGLDDKHIQHYLDEFCYRFNRRYQEAQLFDRLLLACATAPSVTYDELTRQPCRRIKNVETKQHRVS